MGLCDGEYNGCLQGLHQLHNGNVMRCVMEGVTGHVKEWGLLREVMVY